MNPDEQPTPQQATDEDGTPTAEEQDIDEQDRDTDIRDTDIVDKLGDDRIVIPFYAISSYGVDFDVRGLVRRLKEGEVFTPPFQRRYVWDRRRASRFVESLLLGLPVPGIFLAQEERRKPFLVIDGQQRLRLLVSFYEGRFVDTKIPFKLLRVQDKFEGKGYATLTDEDRRMLDNSLIHATVVRQEEPSDDDSGIYHVFERLNTGGVLLRDQEIRACIYHGALNELLSKLNQHELWQRMVGSIPRRRDEELILRYFALLNYFDQYARPMKRFLNRYMKANRELERQNEEALLEAFEQPLRMCFEAFSERAFRPRGPLNAAVFDSLMIGLKHNIDAGQALSLQVLQQRYDELMNDADYNKATSTNTSDPVNIRSRIEKTKRAFAAIQ